MQKEIYLRECKPPYNLVVVYVCGGSLLTKYATNDKSTRMDKTP
jgi:hypothetical protein